MNIIFQEWEEKEAHEPWKWSHRGLPQRERLFEVKTAPLSLKPKEQNVLLFASQLIMTICKVLPWSGRVSPVISHLNFVFVFVWFFLFFLATTKPLQSHPGSFCRAVKTSWSRQRKTESQLHCVQLLCSRRHSMEADPWLKTTARATLSSTGTGTPNKNPHSDDKSHWGGGCVQC